MSEPDYSYAKDMREHEHNLNVKYVSVRMVADALRYIVCATITTAYVAFILVLIRDFFF